MDYINDATNTIHELQNEDRETAINTVGTAPAPVVVVAADHKWSVHMFGTWVPIWVIILVLVVVVFICYKVSCVKKAKNIMVNIPSSARRAVSRGTNAVKGWFGKSTPATQPLLSPTSPMSAVSAAAGSELTTKQTLNRLFSSW
jgi:hypothetical protein